MRRSLPQIGRLEWVQDTQDSAASLIRLWLEAHRDEIRPKNLDAATYVLLTAVEALTHDLIMRRPAGIKDADLAEEIADLIVCYLARG
jgi:hypothetical protein